jgi:hypothetical protein
MNVEDSSTYRLGAGQAASFGRGWRTPLLDPAQLCSESRSVTRRVGLAEVEG